MDFSDTTCVITGGANGIGRCLVEHFITAGARVAFTDTDKDAGEELVRRLGTRALFIAADMAEEDAVSSFARIVIERFGVVNFLVNNACISRKGIISGCGYADFTYVLRLGVTAPYMLALLFRNAFAENAAIVNIASSRAFMSQADTESYSAAKGGISALTHALSASLAGRVRVNAVSPGWIDTSAYQKVSVCASELSKSDMLQHPAGRVGKPEDVAAMVMFLCGKEAGFVTGQNFVVDGGMTRQMVYHGDNGWTFWPEK